MKAVVEWIALLMLAVGLGLGAAAAQAEFGISRSAMDVALIVVMSAALAYGLSTWWRFIRAVRDEDEQDLP